MTTRPWTVNTPGPLTQLRPDVWYVDDLVPGLNGATRRMTVCKRADGGLLFFNAVPIPDETLTQVRALGTPAQVILPNRFHMLDAAAFIEKLGVTAYAPEVELTAIRERCPAKSIGELPADPKLTVFAVDGFKTHETVVQFGDVLITADVVTNAPNGSGFNGFMMKLVGFTGPEPKLPGPVWMRVGKDKRAVKELLLKLADQPLVTIVPSHGAVITSGAPSVLKNIAAQLR